MGKILSLIQYGRMNGSTKACCSIFCCPPFPSTIAIKLAFVAPPPTYKLDKDYFSLRRHIKYHQASLCSEFESKVPQKFAENIEFRMLDFYHSHKARISVVFIKPYLREKRPTLLWNHGNWTDVGLLMTDLATLSQQLYCNICTYDYPEFGASTGRLTQRSVYICSKQVYHMLNTTFNVKSQDIIFVGEGLGSSVAVNLARSKPCAGLVLIEPILSVMRMVCPLKKRYYWDIFDNSKELEEIECSILVVHGMDDEIINIEHSHELMNHIKNAVEPLFIEGAKHTECVNSESFIPRLAKYINKELNFTT